MSLTWRYLKRIHHCMITAENNSTTCKKTMKTDLGMTLLDWLSLLAVPLALAIFGFWLQKIQRKPTEDATKEEVLQGYFDRLSVLLVDKNVLAIAAKGNEATDEEQEQLDSATGIIRVMTLSILRKFEEDIEQKTSIIRFLIAADIVSELNLSDANLSGVNLSDANLSDANLSSANLSSANLSGAYLKEANLSGANLSSANLSHANLRRTIVDTSTQLDPKWRLVQSIVTQGAANQNLSSADLSDAYLGFANLSSANLRDANLSSADLGGANLRGTIVDTSTQLDPKWRLVQSIVTQGAANQNLSGADLSDADLSDANLRGADISDANLSSANLSGVNLRDANLRDANLSHANLRRTIVDTSTQLDPKWRLVQSIVTQGAANQNLSGADLSSANLSSADLRGANLRGANLSSADLRGANLRGANLIFAKLSDADLGGADLGSADLRMINSYTPQQIKLAKNWETAQYDSKVKLTLGLDAEPQK